MFFGVAHLCYIMYFKARIRLQTFINLYPNDQVIGGGDMEARLMEELSLLMRISEEEILNAIRRVRLRRCMSCLWFGRCS